MNNYRSYRDSHRPYDSSSNYYRKNDYQRERSYSRSPYNDRSRETSRTSLDYMFYLPTEIAEYLSSEDYKLIKNMENKAGISLFTKFCDEPSVPELEGKTMKLICENSKEKLAFIAQFIQIVSFLQKGRDQFDCQVMLLIPNGLISIIIGSKGKQIFDFNKQSGASIIINQPIFLMKHRLIKITGLEENVMTAIRLIYDILEEKHFEVNNAEVESKPLDLAVASTKVKLLLPQSFLSNEDERTYMLDYVRNKFKVGVNFFLERGNKFLTLNQPVVFLKGTVENVEEALETIFTSGGDQFKDNESDRFIAQLLITKQYITKLIGKDGCMIQSIGQRAGTHDIKILSDKKLEKQEDIPEIPVKISGSVGSIVKAFKMIIEQIECFKQGGPVYC